MPKVTYTISLKDDETLLINSSELLDNYFYGIPICNDGGQQLSNDTIKQKIGVAQRTIENLLGIKFTKQLIRETTNFITEEWGVWNFVKARFNVRKAMALEGYYNQTLQLSYPKDWLSIRQESSSLEVDRDVTFKNIFVVPSGNTNTPTVQGVTFNSLAPYVMSTGFIPNYWFVTYFTGFEKVPEEIIDVIGKLAAIQLFAILGDVYLGVGMSSSSISLDGLSQSTSLLKSNQSGIYGARIRQYAMDLFGENGRGGLIDSLKGIHKGINWDVL
jgi:hypothetical protein